MLIICLPSYPFHSPPVMSVRTRFPIIPTLILPFPPPLSCCRLPSPFLFFLKEIGGAPFLPPRNLVRWVCDSLLLPGLSFLAITIPFRRPTQLRVFGFSYVDFLPQQRHPFFLPAISFLRPVCFPLPTLNFLKKSILGARGGLLNFLSPCLYSPVSSVQIDPRSPQLAQIFDIFVFQRTFLFGVLVNSEV